MAKAKDKNVTETTNEMAEETHPLSKVDVAFGKTSKGKDDWKMDLVPGVIFVAEKPPTFPLLIWNKETETLDLYVSATAKKTYKGVHRVLLGTGGVVAHGRNGATNSIRGAFPVFFERSGKAYLQNPT